MDPPTTRSKTAGKRARIHELTFKPPQTVMETNETKLPRESQGVEADPAPAGNQAGKRTGEPMLKVRLHIFQA